MPRGKKTRGPGGSGPTEDARNGAGPTDPTPASRGRTGTGRPRGRREVTEAAVAIGVEAGGVPVAPPGPSAVAIGLQTTVLQEQLAEVQRQLTEITRQAHEARDVVQSLRGEREQIGRELGELRQQVRAAQEQSLRETREGYSKVGHELNATAGRLGETVRHAQQELAEVVRQAREARRELEDLRRQSGEGRRDEVVIPAPSRPSEGASRAESPAEVEHPNRLGVTVGNGVVVADVLPESPAATAGLTRGDVIEEVNGAGVVSAVQLRDAVVRVGANDWVTLRVVRAGETHELRARLAPEPADEGRDANRNRLGVTVGPGVIVAEVLPGSPAATAGLATGDVIDGFNGRPLHSAHELRELVFHTPDAGDAALRVTRAGELHEMRVLLSPR